MTNACYMTYVTYVSYVWYISDASRLYELDEPF